MSMFVLGFLAGVVFMIPPAMRLRKYMNVWKSYANQYEAAARRAEAALAEIADMHEVETDTATILSSSSLAARLGVDIKSRLP